MAESLRSTVRIARVSTVSFFVATQLSLQIRQIAAAGFQVTVICSPGSEIDELLAHPGVEGKFVDIPRSLSPLRDLLSLWLLWRCFRRQRFDIVHSTTPKAGLLCAIASRLAGVPIRLHTFTGQPWVTRTGLMAWFAKIADRLIGRWNTRCYADSPSQKDFLVRERIVASERLAVLGKGSLAGVDAERFDPRRWTAPQRDELRARLGVIPGHALVTFIGRITTDKGVHELLTAFRSLRARGVALQLLLVGPADDAGGANEALSLSALRADGVLCTGFVADPERYLAISDLLCLPSYREGFGTVVLEAAAMGVPAVGTRIYGLSDAIAEGETGVLVPARDAGALAEALGDLLADAPRRARLGEQARRRCLKDFEAARMTEWLLKEYRRLLAAAASTEGVA
ncbi:MAG: glycosyltransferase [Burkholderiales bacterium]|nr:glycosyltransferase [Burkholderiales bacterium]